MACSEEISENTADTQYTAQTGNIGNAGQAVDLGLPSGTLWANKNVGASSESDNGILFIWGDITGKKIDADKEGTYTNVTEATSMAELYNAFTHETRTDGQTCDTTNIVQISQAKLIDTSSLTDPDKIQEAIVDFLKAKLDDAKKYATGKGFLEATLVNNGSWTVILNLDGSEYKDVRVPDKQTWDQDKFEKVTSVTIDEIVITPHDYKFS